MENIYIEDIRYKKILKGGSIDIAQGEFVLICGRTGSGKTTLLKLLKEKAGTDAGYVMQNPDNQIVCDKVYTELEFAASAGNASRDYVRTRIAETAAYFGISGMLDKEVDKLSGGEKQRISIARMILKNAPIVILDEATAFTDQENEEKIQQSIAALTKGKTLLVIAHRLSTIKNADQIIVLQNGQVENTGTHQQLLDGDALYRDMWEAHIGAQNWSAGSGKGGN